MPSGCQRSWLIGSLSCLVLVLVSTHIPGEVRLRLLQEHMFDKVEHIAAYGLIAILFLLSLRRPMRPALLSGGRRRLAGVPGFDEITQPYFHRTAGIRDYAADVMGIAPACLILFVGKRPRFSVVMS